MISLKKILVVVADSAEAKFYIAHGPNDLKPVEILQHKESRLTNQELTTKESDFITCPYEDKNSMKTHEKLVFAKKVVRNIEKIVDHKNLKDVCIISSPTFLGQLQKNINRNNLELYSVNKDMLTANDAEILDDVKSAGVTFMPT